MLTRPSWIALDDGARRHVRHVWDDTRALLDFSGDPTPVLEAATQMSLRARMVLCIGLYEWNLWRFEGLHGRAEPLQIAEVAWCAAIDPRYMKFFELTRDQWRGPVEGPLWCAATWLQPAMSQGHLFPKGLYDAIAFLTRSALHVLPDSAPFCRWLDATSSRLVESHPEHPVDPFEHLFNRNAPDMLGPLIGRDALDPALSYHPGQGVGFLSRNLFDARDEQNPFLATPADLADTGFTGTPYVVTAA